MLLRILIYGSLNIIFVWFLSTMKSVICVCVCVRFDAVCTDHRTTCFVFVFECMFFFSICQMPLTINIFKWNKWFILSTIEIMSSNQQKTFRMFNVHQLAKTAKNTRNYMAEFFQAMAYSPHSVHSFSYWNKWCSNLQTKQHLTL